MIDLSLITIIIFIFVFVIAVLGHIRNYLNLLKETRILENGVIVNGKVEELQYIMPSKRLARTYYCRPVVSFVWQGSAFTLKTLTTVPRKKYQKGSAVELLYLPEYPNKVVIKDETPTSEAGFAFDSIILLVFLVGFLFVIISLLKQYFS